MRYAVACGSTAPGVAPVLPSGVVTPTRTTAAITIDGERGHELSSAERPDDAVALTLMAEARVVPPLRPRVKLK